MDFSKHIKANAVTHYVYYEYEALSESFRESQKGELQCYGCKASTKFVRSSKSGSQAYFGLMPGEEHEKKCEEIKKLNEGGTQRRKREEKHYIKAVEEIQNATGEIEIDSSLSAQFEKLEGKNEENPKNKKSLSIAKQLGEKGKTHVINSEQIRATRKNLVQLLKFCLYSSSFIKGSGLKLKFKGRPYYSNKSVKQFFQANSIKNTKVPYFFYGSIRGANNSLTFVYVGAEKTQVVIDQAIRGEFWNALEVDKYWQLLDAQMICFGWLNRNKDGKNFIKIKDISDIAIIDVKKNSNFKAYVTPEPKYASLNEVEIIETEELDVVMEEPVVKENKVPDYDDLEFKEGGPDPVITQSRYSPEIEKEQIRDELPTSHVTNISIKKKPSWFSSILSIFGKKINNK